MAGPAALLAVAGVVRLLARPASPAERAAGLAACGAVLFLMLLGGKSYYAGPVYPALIAAGAALLRTAPSRTAPAGHRSSRSLAGRWALGGIAIAQLGYGVVALPMGLPVLAPEPMARYAARLGVAAATRTNTGVQLDLPQDYADMLGWSAFADTVARVFNGLPAADREHASLLATNYGRAGALDRYGRRLGLPRAVAPTGSYWFWGPGERSWQVAVIAGSDSADLSSYFREVRLGARMVDPRRVPEERDVSVWIVRDAFEPISAIWPRFRGQN